MHLDKMISQEPPKPPNYSVHPSPHVRSSFLQVGKCVSTWESGVETEQNKVVTISDF